MNNTLAQILINIGLSEKESRVYLAALETKSAPVSNIASAAGINRVTTYDILEKLKKRGLVSYYTKNKTKFFSPIEPELLVEEYERRTQDLRRALPKFKKINGKTSHPRIRYFEGLEGIKAIYADTLSSKTEILNYANSTEIRNQWPKYDKEYVEKRAKKKIYLRGLAPNDPIAQNVKAQNDKYYREIRLLQSDQFNFTTEINIYDDKVAIISFKNELIGMIIESSEIANSQRAIFEMCWQFSELMEKAEDLKTKMLKPMTAAEIEKSIPETPEPKEQKRDNLSLF